MERNGKADVEIRFRLNGWQLRQMVRRDWYRNSLTESRLPEVVTGVYTDGRLGAVMFIDDDRTSLVFCL